MSKGRPAFVYPKMAGRFDVGLGFSIARVLLSASTSSTSSRVTPWARMCSSFQSSHSATVGVVLLYNTTAGGGLQGPGSRPLVLVDDSKDMETAPSVMALSPSSP